MRSWNSKGYEGLIPNFGGGRPPKLSKEEKEELKRDAKVWLLDHQGDTAPHQDVVCSYLLTMEVRRILKSFGMSFAKPNQKDYRRPDDAEDSLKKLTEVNVGEADVLGFVDEMAVEANANTARIRQVNKFHLSCQEVDP